MYEAAFLACVEKNGCDDIFPYQLYLLFRQRAMMVVVKCTRAEKKQSSRSPTVDPIVALKVAPQTCVIST